MFQDVQKTAGHIPVNVLIVSLASTEFENGSSVRPTFNTAISESSSCPLHLW